ncbi:hypothetical protein BgiBS90_031355, partial [Biomphalaria glabrata]
PIVVQTATHACETWKLSRKGCQTWLSYDGGEASQEPHSEIWPPTERQPVDLGRSTPPCPKKHLPEGQPYHEGRKR